MTTPVEAISVKMRTEHHAWWQVSGVHELKETLQVTIPLIVLLLCILKYVLKEKIPMVCRKEEGGGRGTEGRKEEEEGGRREGGPSITPGGRCRGSTSSRRPCRSPFLLLFSYFVF
jgi:hypothetical protein